MRYRNLTLLAFGGLLALASGCAENKMTRQNFDTIAEGSASKLDVKMTMGDEYDDHGDSWEFEDEKKHVAAYFYFNDKGTVIRKQWWDADKADVEGVHPNLDKKE